MRKVYPSRNMRKWLKEMAEHFCRKNPSCVGGWLWLLVLLAHPMSAMAETVKLPMTFDFGLLRALIVEQAYPEQSERARVVVMQEGCNEIWLSNPQLREEDGFVRLQTDVDITWGAPVAGSCLAPLNWSGSLVIRQKPVIDVLWQLRFTTKNSTLLDASGKEAVLPSLIWELMKKHTYAYVDSIVINLAPPIDNLKRFMVPEAANKPLTAAERFLASMRPDEPQVRTDGLALNILADADIPQNQPREQEAPVVESPEVQVQIMALWQSWDALLVNVMSQISAKDLTEEDRQLLLDTLLTVRYDFSEVVGSPALTTTFVRSQFINSWVALKPLFQRHLTPKPGDSVLGYLSFFTAADALVTLDRLGPLIGIEISREGFYRLAHMLSDKELNEGEAVDLQLRDALGLGAPMVVPPEENPPAQPAETEIDKVQDEGAPLPLKEDEDLQDNPDNPDSPGNPDNPDNPDNQGAGVFNWPLWKRIFGPAEACAANAPHSEAVKGWTAGMTPAETLLPKIQKVLMKAAKAQESRLDTTVHSEGWGHAMVAATAWQESCFRQFVAKGQEITYLRSYSGSAVGIMQVNEKVWRGIYDLQELRWNIEYNSMAGTEILALYLNRYLARNKKLGKYDDEAGRRYLASWLYALYNGGPGQIKKFPERSSSGKLNATDKQFQENYDQVVDGPWLDKVKCLPAG